MNLFNWISKINPSVFLERQIRNFRKKVFAAKGHRRGSAFKMQNITFRNLALSALKNPQLIMTSHII